MPTTQRRRLPGLRGPIVALVTLASILALSGCTGSDSDSDGPATPTGAASVLGDAYPRHTDEASGLSVILGTPDLAVGTHRVAFVLSDADGLIRLPVLDVASFRPDEADNAAQDATARYYDFPLGIRGIHVTELSFDQAGDWALEVRVPTPTGAFSTARFDLPVAEETSAPAIGDRVPASVSRTVEDVDVLDNLSTGAEIDPALYALSIDEALENGLPSMIVFASPGFCTNALCGPQVEVMSELRAMYPDGANYIHVDLFENPVELRTGGLERAIRSPLLDEWGLRTDEWTFLVDANGRVTHRYEAFVPIEELEPALTSMLAN
jgi:hypothetical protein